MEKYNIIKRGEDVYDFAEKIAAVQRRAGINVTGELDFETKKLFVIPRCGNTEADDKPSQYEGRLRRNRRSYPVCSHVPVSLNRNCER